MTLLVTVDNFLTGGEARKVDATALEPSHLATKTVEMVRLGDVTPLPADAGQLVVIQQWRFTKNADLALHPITVPNTHDGGRSGTVV